MLSRELGVPPRVSAPSVIEKPATDPTQLVLETLEQHDRLVRLLQADLTVLVTEAHFRGVTWAEIARRLDRAKQTVHQRYQRRVHSRRTHEALRHDLERAHQHALALSRRRIDQGEARELRSFLGDRFSVGQVAGR